MAWAEKLRNHALIQYAPIGQHCYHAIKGKSGLSHDMNKHPYGNFIIESIVPIRETLEKGEPRYDADKDVLYLDMKYLRLRRGKVDCNNPNSTQNIYLFGPKACYLFLIRGLYHLCSDDAEEFTCIRVESTATAKSHRKAYLPKEQWDKKLETCYHLFNYAWSIAGNGCSISPSKGKAEEKILTRDMHVHQQGIDNGIHDAHAKSVWSLYPHLVTEVADIGKVFAAACAALRIYSSEQTKIRIQEIDSLLNSLSCADEYEIASDLKLAMNGQVQLNSHLRYYLEMCTREIKKTVDTATKTPQGKVSEKRDKLLKTLFSLTAIDKSAVN